MQNCTSCGAELADHMSFCTTCGTAVPADSTPAPPPPPAPVASTPPPPPSPSGPAAHTPDHTAEPENGGQGDGQLLGSPVVAEQDETSTDRPRSWLRRHRLLIASRVLLVLALLGTGILLGWLWASDRSLVESDLDAPVAEEIGADADPVSVTMPDLRGLTTAQAEQVLADAGVPASEVVVVDQPAAGTAGVVIEQEPVYGQPVEGKVTITGSTAATVPSIRGRTAKAVLAELDEFGAEVRTISRYVPGAEVGSVVSIKPAPGTPLPVAVSVTIAAEPGEVALGDLASEDYNCSVDDEQMNGTAYVGLVSCSAYDEPESSAWLINRAANRLTATIGIPDSSGTGSDRARLVVRGDGRVLGTFELTYGSTEDIDVDVTGVLRLSLEYSSPDDDGSAVGLGDALLLGDQDQLDLLETDQ